MATKTARIRLDGEGLRFSVKTGSGHRFVLDSSEGNSGPSPAELVPAAAAACAAMDVISILRKKRQDVAHYEIEAVGTQSEDQPPIFTRLDVTHIVEGPALDVAAVRRAIELSATKYCAVGGTLAAGATEIHHAYLTRSGKGRWESGEVMVTGPFHSLLTFLDGDVGTAPPLAESV
jgi:putative redox protein